MRGSRGRTARGRGLGDQPSRVVEAGVTGQGRSRGRGEAVLWGGAGAAEDGLHGAGGRGHGRSWRRHGAGPWEAGREGDQGVTAA